jgi:hypothetical protein
MSLAAEILRHIPLRTNPVPPLPGPLKVEEGETDPILVALVQTIFFPSPMVCRSHVLLTAADGETGLFALCARLGTALAGMAGATVAVAGAKPDQSEAVRNKPRSRAGGGQWRSSSSQISERVWRLPSSIFTAQAFGRDGWTPDDTLGLQSAFDHVLFAATVSDSDFPLLASMCDAAVLVVTANRTRREAALHAKEVLIRNKVDLLGTVLDERVLPIPEAIYRRL